MEFCYIWKIYSKFKEVIFKRNEEKVLREVKHFPTIVGVAILSVVSLGFGVGARVAVESVDRWRAVPPVDSRADEERTVSPLAARVPPPEEPQKYQLLFVGDIMLDRGVRYFVEREGGGDFQFPFQKIATLVRAADVAFGNLEGPLSDQGREIGNLYSFRMPVAALEGLRGAGFDVLSLANNHIGDWGLAALKDTVSRLEAAGIAPVGVAAVPGVAPAAPAMVNVGNTRIAFLAFADFEDQYRGSDVAAHIAFAREETVREAVRAARTVADLVVVAFHWGTEYLEEPTARQQMLAHLAIDEGADLVVGSHPHILQTLEEYRGKYIAYSLGNFVFDQGFSRDTMTGGMLSVMVENRGIVDVVLHPVRLNNHFQPQVE